MNRPNIILISIDTLRADHLSCYGYKRKTTPNIDRIAEEGVLFKNAYSTSVWTPPAHASMLTGLYPSQHGVVDENKLDNQIPTLAEILQSNGYRTAGFVNNPAVGQLIGLDRGYDSFHEIWRGLASRQIFHRAIHKVREALGYTDHWASKTNQITVNWLTNRRDIEKPFYIFIHYIEPHNPLMAPKPFRWKYLKKPLIGQVDMRKIRKVAKNPLICLTDDMELNELEIEALTCLYDEEIAYLDCRIGQLLKWLNSQKLLEDTLLIITADHGEHLGEKGLYSHVASLYEPIVHIPLIMRYPELIEASSLNDALVQLIDIVPTILQVAGLEIESFRFSGVPLLPLQQKQEYHDYIIAEWEGRIPNFVKARLAKLDKSHNTNKYTTKLTMLREGPYKFIQNSNGKEELYNLSVDREESNNLVVKEKANSDMLRRILKDWLLQNKNNQEIAREQYLLDKITKERLQALGYI